MERWLPHVAFLNVHYKQPKLRADAEMKFFSPSLVGVFMYKSHFSVVKKDSDRSALVNVKARPTDNPTPHTYTTSFHSYDMVVSVALEHVCSHYLCFEGRPSQAGALKS